MLPTSTVLKNKVRLQMLNIFPPSGNVSKIQIALVNYLKISFLLFLPSTSPLLSNNEIFFSHVNLILQRGVIVVVVVVVVEVEVGFVEVGFVDVEVVVVEVGVIEVGVIEVGFVVVVDVVVLVCVTVVEVAVAFEEVVEIALVKAGDVVLMVVVDATELALGATTVVVDSGLVLVTLVEALIILK